VLLTSATSFRQKGRAVGLPWGKRGFGEGRNWGKRRNCKPLDWGTGELRKNSRTQPN